MPSTRRETWLKSKRIKTKRLCLDFVFVAKSKAWQKTRSPGVWYQRGPKLQCTMCRCFFALLPFQGFVCVIPLFVAPEFFRHMSVFLWFNVSTSGARSFSLNHSGLVQYSLLVPLHLLCFFHHVVIRRTRDTRDSGIPAKNRVPSSHSHRLIRSVFDVIRSIHKLTALLRPGPPVGCPKMARENWERGSQRFEDLCVDDQGHRRRQFAKSRAQRLKQSFSHLFLSLRDTTICIFMHFVYVHLTIWSWILCLALVC